MFCISGNNALIILTHFLNISVAIYMMSWYCVLLQGGGELTHGIRKHSKSYNYTRK